MKTLIISSSLNPDSKSYLLCRMMAEVLQEYQDVELQFIDARELDLQHVQKEASAQMKELSKLVEDADNYIISMPVHNYSTADACKTITEACFDKKAKHKMFGIISTAGSQVSYLATAHLVQSLMYEFKMIPFPHMVFAHGGDFEDGKLSNEKIEERISDFAKQFVEIGSKLLENGT